MAEANVRLVTEAAQTTALGGVVKGVIVSTGNEPRPTADVVLWVSSSGVTPINAIATDLIASPTTGGGTVDNTAPSVPTNLAASSITDTGFVVSWTASTDDTGVTGYQVEVGGVVLTTTVSTSYTVTGRTAGTNYTVRVRARDATGNWSAWATLAGGVTTTTTGATGVVYSNNFDGLADGTAATGWINPDNSVPTVTSGALVPSAWGAYNRMRYHNVPKNVKVDITFASVIDVYQGIFIGWTNTSGVGIKFFNSGGQWVIGNASAVGTQDTNVSGIPAGVTKLSLSYDGTNVTAWADDTQVFQGTFAALGITALDAASGSVFDIGYCGEPKNPHVTDVVVTAL